MKNKRPSDINKNTFILAKTTKEKRKEKHLNDIKNKYIINLY